MRARRAPRSIRPVSGQTFRTDAPRGLIRPVCNVLTRANSLNLHAQPPEKRKVAGSIPALATEHHRSSNAGHGSAAQQVRHQPQRRADGRSRQHAGEASHDIATAASAGHISGRRPHARWVGRIWCRFKSGQHGNCKTARRRTGARGLGFIVDSPDSTRGRAICGPHWGWEESECCAGRRILARVLGRRRRCRSRLRGRCQCGGRPTLC